MRPYGAQAREDTVVAGVFSDGQLGYQPNLVTASRPPHLLLDAEPLISHWK